MSFPSFNEFSGHYIIEMFTSRSIRESVSSLVVDFDDRAMHIQYLDGVSHRAQYPDSGDVNTRPSPLLQILRTVPSEIRSRVIFLEVELLSISAHGYMDIGPEILDVIGSVYDIEPSFFTQSLVSQRAPILADSMSMDPLLDRQSASTDMYLAFDFDRGNNLKAGSRGPNTVVTMKMGHGNSNTNISEYS